MLPTERKVSASTRAEVSQGRAYLGLVLDVSATNAVN
jgi:hypothetical protein